MTLRENSAAQPGQPITKPCAPQIINEDQLRCRRFHTMEQQNGICFVQMMQKQAAHHDIVCWLRKGLLKCVALKKSYVVTMGRCCLVRCKSQGGGADVATIDRDRNAVSLSETGQSNGKIATPSRKIQDGQRSFA